MRTIGFLLTMVLGVVPYARTDEPLKKCAVITPRDDGIMATGINGHGEIVGFEDAELPDLPGVIAQRPFFARGKEITYLPLLPGYTATFPAAVSDEGLVVGRASKPAPPGVRVLLRNQAFVWDAQAGIRGLGVLEDDSASFACGITRDGRCISGFSVGAKGSRACLWERHDGGNGGMRWRCRALPQEFALGSNVVAISDDGTHVAAVDGVLPCLWSRDAAGNWSREVIGEASSLVPRAVNNFGTVAGVRFTGDGLTHAVVWTRDQGYKRIEEPEGYVRSEASAVNNGGAVVGMIDGPGGSPIGPNAFLFEAGRLRRIDEGGPNFAAATAINDQGQVTGVMEKPEEPVPARAAPGARPK
jgi:uncharacterized membrane protein